MKLCLTLAARSKSTLNDELRRYCGKVGLIEVRLDALERRTLPELPAATSTRFIATCRPTREGGAYDGEEATRIEWLGEAARHGFDWIDVEFDCDGPADVDSSRLIRSRHVFSPPERSLDELGDSVDRVPGAVSKLAVQIEDTSQLVQLLTWMERRPKKRPMVTVGMGVAGRSSRLLGGLSGNEWAYVSPGAEVAPGQFTLAEAQTLYRLDSWSNPPQLYGVVGNPVAHSLSPRLHNTLFRHYGLNRLYVPLHITDLDPWFEYLAETELDFQGFSVTLPYKQQLSRFISNSDPGGPFNTLSRQGGKWLAIDTDGAGFLTPLRARIRLQDTTVVVLGNGGVAARVVAALCAEGARVTVCGRRPEAARSLAEDFGCAWADLGQPPDAEVCVNATPVGQFPEVGDSPLRGGQICYRLVYDLVYNPPETRLLRLATQQGAETISGLEMFLEQAARQFHIWTGIEPSRELMRELLEVKG